MDGTIDVRMVLSGISFAVTSYFWLVQARKERPRLEFYQLSHFRLTNRRHPEQDHMRRLCFQQLETGGVLAVNHSTRQNSIVLFECWLLTPAGEFRGDWGFGGDDRPPWNIGPETTIALSPACFFDVPADLELPENPIVQVDFITASGKTFSHHFTQEAPRLGSAEEPLQRAA
ncbi:hypothetical protein Mal4_27850 [Maioricimonas rarisocia]|uniref:Uncharacterized protein n=1 Tax=Maioricimonas rarisocia TaxID=2528026 RepID=A0A517Z7K4_9PLAN|nr:hypothetical protein [Maioricimonas rarisocia]QDU38458.1 hypothetical protein Mal4_27850 [Maioricimonas rarisocia]